MERLLRVLLICGAAALTFTGRPAAPQVVLKPRGDNGMPLRTKAVKAEVRIDGQFAASRLELTFQNETYDRIEAEFLYSLPPETVVSYFAYWYGEEKVVARIVEKERAAEIYRHITTRQRDPALIEMLSGNTFRARIFPVMPNADLRVEMHLAQVLPSDPQGVFFDLPLKVEPGQALESIDIAIRAVTEPGTQVANNYGLPVAHDGDEQRISLSGKNFRPQRDLRVNLRRGADPLHAALYSGRSGGATGFFALALTPAQALTQPKVTIEGVAASEIVPAALPDVRAHRTLAIFGRYRGSGPATVRLSGQTPNGPVTYTRTVTFSRRAEPNHLGVKLWAARRIEQLTRGGADAATILQLSKRYSLPSKYSSWLAVPREEMRLYQREKLQSQIQSLAARLAREAALGQEGSREARGLRSRLQALCRQAGLRPQDVMAGYTWDSISTTAEELAREVEAGRGGGVRARRLRSRVRSLARLSGQDVKAALQSAGQDRLFEAAYLLVDEEDRTDKKLLRRRIDRLASYFEMNKDRAMQDAKEAHAWRRVVLVRDRLYAERLKPEPDPARVKALEEEFLELHRLTRGEEEGRIRIERLAAKTDLLKLENALLEARSEFRPEAELAQLERQRLELSRREDELRARMGDPLIQITAPADARQVVALMPDGEVKRLAYNPESRKWEVRFDIPTYAAEGPYVVTVIVVLADGTRKSLTFRYHVDVTPPSGSGRVHTVATPEPVLRLELDASPDTARVTALLPWGEQLRLRATAKAPGRFFALAAVPESHRGSPTAVTFVLTDRAHNRTQLTVDLSDETR
ncbi:MAG: VIT domain-containing protein [Armatimonadota bacterium]